MSERPFYGHRIKTRAPMHDVMLDLETFGTGSFSVIAAVGAVYFDPMTGELGESFYAVATDMEEQQKKYGRTVDMGATLWWMEQSEQARSALYKPGPAGKKTLTILSDFASFIQQPGDSSWRSTARIWGNGSDFDNVILAELYKGANLRLPWSFRNNMCYRSLKTLATLSEFQAWGAPRDANERHNALDDAKFQADMAARFYIHLRLTGNG